eukprot:TRINITY_DN7647_c0_g1_i1.p1 TRINITY_DN7647_c0_g1~~TRINITY_DN7647_c0_g1_i1.p1  ORF type:complete len:396 (+),score=73.16 TRINITY_DN7647_c0_g1_i1:42-1190(+)
MEVESTQTHKLLSQQLQQYQQQLAQQHPVVQRRVAELVGSPTPSRAETVLSFGSSDERRRKASCMRRDAKQGISTRLAIYLGVAVLIEALGAVFGSFSISGAHLRGVGCCVVVAACGTILYLMIKLKAECPPRSTLDTSVAFLTIGSALRLGGETKLLRDAWALPVLPKLSLAYCRQQCLWQREDLFSFRMKEFTAIISNFLFVMIFLTSVASAYSRSLSHRVRLFSSIKIVLTLLCLVIAQNAFGEGLLLQVHTVGGMIYAQQQLNISSNGLDTKLRLTASGAALEMIASIWVVVVVNMSSKPIRSLTAACVALLIGGMLRLYGECSQLHPYSIWSSLGMSSSLILEMVSRMVATLLFTTCAIGFCAVSLRYSAVDDFGVT